jgi:hypothetical protein
MGLFIALGFILGFVSPWAFLGQPIVAAVAAGLLIRVYLENLKRWSASASIAPIASAAPAAA